jgi:hypothetical protein
VLIPATAIAAAAIAATTISAAIAAMSAAVATVSAMTAMSAPVAVAAAVSCIARASVPPPRSLRVEAPHEHEETEDKARDDPTSPVRGDVHGVNYEGCRVPATAD